MGCDYEGSENNRQAVAVELETVVSPLKSRRLLWEYDRYPLYKRRNEMDRLFRRLKEYRRVFFRLDKLDLFFGSIPSPSSLMHFVGNTLQTENSGVNCVPTVKLRRQFMPFVTVFGQVPDA